MQHTFQLISHISSYSSLVVCDLNKQQQLKRNSNAENYTEEHFVDKLMVFTDGSKDPKIGGKGASRKRTLDHLSVYAVELLAILIALQWVEENNKYN